MNAGRWTRKIVTGYLGLIRKVEADHLQDGQTTSGESLAAGYESLRTDKVRESGERPISNNGCKRLGDEEGAYSVKLA